MSEASAGVKREYHTEESPEDAAKRLRGDSPDEAPAFAEPPAAILDQAQQYEQGPPGETRICFPYLNRGMCNFGANCRFRHLSQDHPDAIADRVRTGHINKITAPPEQVEQVQQQLAQAGMPASSESTATARICFPFLNHGRCNHENCRFRHLPQDHPDAVADRMRTGAYDKIPAHVNPMIDQNPNSKLGETRICYTYLNRGACERPECIFRHLLPGHPDAVADRIKNGQGHKIPAYAKEALARVEAGPPPMAGPPQMPILPGGAYGAPPGAGFAGPPTGFGGGGRSMGGPMAGNGMGPDAMHYWQQQQYASAGGWEQMQQGYGAGYPGPQPGYPPPPFPPGVQAGGQYPPYGGHQHGGGPAPGEQRICFPFLNRGACERGAACRYRHLTPDHPDAVADRMRTGRAPPQHAPAMQQYAGCGVHGAFMPASGSY